MIWDDESLFDRIFAEVWVAMRLAPPHPRKMHPHPRHQSALVPAPHPVARSWLGGRYADPPSTSPHHTDNCTLTH